MEDKNNKFKVAGYFSIAGSVSMLIGAMLWGASGTDIWTALATNNMADYISRLDGARALLVANTSFWILGVILMGITGSMMDELCLRNRSFALIGRVCVRTGVSIAIVAFIAMLAPVLHISPDTSQNSLNLATTIGWIGSKLDDIATILIIGVGTFCFSIAGYGEWVPKWLRTWGYLAGVVVFVAILGNFITILSLFSFVLLPFGIGWMIAAGVVLINRKS